MISPATTEASIIDPDNDDESPGISSETSADTTEDSVNSSMESATPVIEEDSTIAENSDAMDTQEETVRVPVIQARNTPETIDGTNSTATLKDETLDKNDDPPLPLEEIKLLFCASDEAEAKLLSQRNFPRSKYIGKHKIKNHHIFSIHPTSKDVPFLKKDLNKLNNKVNLIALQVISENKNYYPDKQHHCQECCASYNLKK